MCCFLIWNEEARASLFTWREQELLRSLREGGVRISIHLKIEGGVYPSLDLEGGRDAHLSLHLG